MNQKRYEKELILSICCIVAGLLFYGIVIPAQIRIVQGAQNEVFSPDTFPRLLTMVFILCGAVNALNAGIRLSRAKKQEDTGKEEKVPQAKGLYPVLIPYLVFGAAVLYVVLFQQFGFLCATILVPPLVLALLKCRKWYFYLITYLFAALMYAVFRLALQVPLR